MSDCEIKVSICCLVYNHKKYLRQCLDGFVMQKTDFLFEILIHDDASTDGSACIIEEYKNNFPDIIKPIIQEENKLSKGEPISWKYQLTRAKGKYIAFCEGDDYWTDEYKLQKQFDALETVPEAVMCTHKVQCVEEDGKQLEATIPNKSIRINKYMSSSNWIKLQLLQGYVYQTSSYFFRKSCIEQFITHSSDYANWEDLRPEFMKVAPTGDEPLLLYLCTKGGMVYIDSVMSSYRISAIGSWSLRRKEDNYVHYTESMIKMLHSYDVYTNYNYSEEIQYRLLKIEYTFNVINKNFKELNNRKYRAFLQDSSLKGKTYILICAYCPWFDKMYDHIKSRLHALRKCNRKYESKSK